MSAIIMSRSTDPMEAHVDEVVQSEQNAPHEAGLRSIQRTYSEARAATAKINTSDELTSIGKHEARQRIIEQASGTLDKQNEHVERLAEKAAATRAKALEVPASERTTEVLMLEREIRDRLAAEKLDPISFGPRFYQALIHDDGPFLRAVERAPKAYSLLDEKMRESLEEHRIKQSPLRDRLADEEQTHRLFRGMVAHTRRELQNLAGRRPF